MCSLTKKGGGLGGVILRDYNIVMYWLKKEENILYQLIHIIHININFNFNINIMFQVFFFT